MENLAEDAAHHLSVGLLLLYAFRQQSSSSYWYSYAASGILHYFIVAKRLDGWRRHLVRK